MLQSLNELAEYCDPTTKVVVIGHYNDVGLYRELIRSGISEYVVAPISMADVVSVISTIFVDPESEPIGRSIAFIGAKGGVGSSTIAHNVGWAMSSLFKSEVVVADLDLAFGTANINFDQDPAQGIAEAVFSPERIDEVYLDRLLAQCAEHLSLLAAPSTLERVYDFDQDAFTQIIDTAQRSAPLLVLDMPHVWTGWSRATLTKADDVVVTATPELANLRNTKNIVDMLKAAEAKRSAAQADHQSGGRAKAPGDQAGRFRRAARHLSDGGHPVRAAAVRQRLQQRAHAWRDGGRPPGGKHHKRDRACADRPQRDQDEEEGRPRRPARKRALKKK